VMFRRASPLATPMATACRTNARRRCAVGMTRRRRTIRMFLTRRVDYAMGLAIAGDVRITSAWAMRPIIMVTCWIRRARATTTRKIAAAASENFRRWDEGPVDRHGRALPDVASVQSARRPVRLGSGRRHVVAGTAIRSMSCCIQPGRHYGFPPRHPTHLPGVAG
jgi:hypothetical protein